MELQEKINLSAILAGKKEKTYSIIFDDDESVELAFSANNKRLTLVVKKEE